MCSLDISSFLLPLEKKAKKMYNKRATQYRQNDVRNILFLLLMGGRARKASLRMSDLGCHDRPFLVGSKL